MSSRRLHSGCLLKEWDEFVLSESSSLFRASHLPIGSWAVYGHEFAACSSLYGHGVILL